MGKTIALCESCRLAIPQTCRFMKCADPVAGLLAMGATSETQETTSGRLYRVVSCPVFEQGPLPPLKGSVSRTHVSE